MTTRSKLVEPRAAADTGAPSLRAPIDPVALSDLFASLAHDLRSPLGVVSQAVGELEADFAAQLTDEHRLLVSLADRGLLRLGRIADMLSLVAALESPGFETKRHSVDLVDLLRSAAASALALEPRREVTLTCDLPEGPCRILADENRLLHALTEVVINAIRYARGQARIGLVVESGEATVAVEDDGEGVPALRRETLFHRYTPRRSRAGLGIGLSIAHDVIAANGGRIRLEASTLPAGRPGTVGALFSISLPIEAAP